MLSLIGKILRLLINGTLLSFFLCFTSTCFAKTTLEALPHTGDHSIITAIESAKHTIQITLYGFTDKKIAAALIKKQSEGINVQLLIEDEPYNASGENLSIVKQLKKAGIAIHYTASTFSFTHQKTLIIDHQRAMILTGNFTYSGVYRQRNFTVTTNDIATIENLNRLFEADWNHTDFSPLKNTALITSPENSWPALHGLIKNSHYQLDIYALELADKRIIHALLKQKSKIRIIISRSTKIVDKNKWCQQQHIEVRRLGSVEQHAKALLSDYGKSNALAYVGSANLTYTSLSKNREVGVLFSDHTALSQLHKTFEQDWKHSRSIC